MNLPNKSVHVSISILGICILATVSGCASTGGHTEVDPSLTLEDAKSAAQRMAADLAAYVPSDVVASVDQRPTGVLLRCSTEDAYQWTGATIVRLAAGKRVNAEEITSDIVAAYNDVDSLAARVEQTSDGEPRAHIVGPHGAGYLVSEDPDRAGVRIASFSPCFVLPDGMSPSKQY